MRAFLPASIAGLGLLAGCAAPRPPAPQAALPQAPSLSAQVLAVRLVSVSGAASPAYGQVLQTLSSSQGAAPAQAQEIVLKMQDGTVKSIVPPPGVAPAALAPGMAVSITESPLTITPR